MKNMLVVLMSSVAVLASIQETKIERDVVYVSFEDRQGRIFASGAIDDIHLDRQIKAGEEMYVRQYKPTHPRYTSRIRSKLSVN